jgi:saccharopine dehydrogenase-like NADP-dependent oxidoreductase
MSQKYLLILGCGMQGRAALHDLYHRAAPHPIVVADIRPGLSD